MSQQQAGRQQRQPIRHRDWDRGLPFEQPTGAPGPTTPSSRPVARQAALVLLATAIIGASLITILIVELWLAERTLPGVYVWDIDVGGLTRAEVMARLEREFRYPDDRFPLLRYGNKTWPVDPAYLGTRLDTAATADTALSVGHRGDLLAQAEEQLDVLLNGVLVRPTFAFDAGTGIMFLSQIASQINRPLRNASLALGKGLSVEVIPGQVGLEVDEEATLESLTERLSEMSGGEIDLVVRESEPLLADLGAAQAQVQDVFSQPITLTAPGQQPWVIEPRTLANWLLLRPVVDEEGQPALVVRLDTGLVTAFVEEIAAQVAQPPQDARFRFDDASGSLVVAVDSQPGVRLDITTTVALVESAATSDQRTVSLPLLPVRPSIASEDGPSLGIVNLIGEGTTSFAGSTASRVQNIVIGAAQFDGLLIAPGETFSFNHYLGEVTAERGYEESIIIWGNTTRADVGGGLCQVSSTAFRAAFWAGLPIVERWPHAFRVRYYEPPVGLDATIYSPSVDLKWLNDTGHHILIQTYVDKAKSTLTFRLYGANPGRTIEMDGPHESNPVPHGPPIYREDPTLPKGQTRQIEWAKDGLDVTIYRLIKKDGVLLARDAFFSRYQPWQPVYLMGTKED